MGRKLGVLVISLGVFALGGCAELTSIQYEFGAWRNKVATIDAKQRTISIQKLTGGPNGDRLSVCVEQSPDVFSLLSGSFALSAETKGAVATLAGAIAESGGSLAFRTQVTQAQTNLLHSICQMYASGAISDQAVRTELRRFQHSLLGILAIEQLTSPGRGQATQQILTTSKASVGEDVKAAESRLQLAKNNRDRAEQELLDAIKTADKIGAEGKDPEKDPAYKEALETVKVRKQKRDLANDELDLAEKLLTAARLALSVSAGAAQSSIINVSTGPTGVDKKVAEQVVAALELTLHRGVVIDYCSEVMFEGTKPPREDLLAICHFVIREYVDMRKMAQERAAELQQSQLKYCNGILTQIERFIVERKPTAADFASLLNAMPAFCRQDGGEPSPPDVGSGPLSNTGEWRRGTNSPFSGRYGVKDQ